MRRRTVLASVATLPALAGCLGVGDSDDGSADGGENDDSTADDAGTADDASGADDGSNDGPDDGAAASGNQAAASALDEHPSLGAAPGDADWLIVAFEDPACPTCASFHKDDLPQLRSEVLDAGDATYVWRPYRFVSQHYPWNSEAMHAVYETVDRDDEAAWILLDHYYGNQNEVSESNVVEHTRTALGGTDVDVEAVVDAMETGAHSERIGESERHAEAAGVTSTPTFVLFDGDEYVTNKNGSLNPTELRAAFEA